HAHAPGEATFSRKSEKKQRRGPAVKAEIDDLRSDNEKPKEPHSSYPAKPDDVVEYADEEDEEEDQLTRIVRRQREAFSARAAAGRPSVRNTEQPSTATVVASPGERKLSGSNAAAIARITQTDKVLREWKALARKVICKVARQWIASRRERVAQAKRAAKECARLMRQRALSSQKAAKDAIVRGHRLSRELASHWRNSAISITNGNGPLNINGIIMPSNIDLVLQSDYFTNAKPDSSSGDGTMVESAAAARRRAERAVAEQRRADLELLEARRQQRKLNFLITQTELYAHFMARKLEHTPTSQNVPTVLADAEDISCTNVEGQSLESIEVTSEEIDAQRILRRLEESDEEPDVETADCTVSITKFADSVDELDPVSDEPTVSGRVVNAPSASGISIAAAARAAAHRLGINTEDEYDIARLKSEAMSKVKLAVERERYRKSQFQMIQPPSRLVESTDPLLSVDHDQTKDAPHEPQVEAPQLFRGQLKEYQLRGLNWLLSLFDQGINGILADEMGLGKTIQTIAFLGHLAEKYGIWGPFLVVAPASTLHNWSQEFAKFLPAFRLVPYWGSPAERRVLRRFWSFARPTNPNRSENIEDLESVGTVTDGIGSRCAPGTRDAEMHVVVTSYQIVLQDAKFINKTAWSYIVLDEAHAIKSTSSLRWRLLLSFKCRNRLLLTGTPIQNTMQELWALLHFIMPTLFDSHDEFANWFSRDIESQVTANAGSVTIGGGMLATSKLNANQLSRLHLILKPFMLRRIKTEVEHEISTKTEIMRYCPLSRRQQTLYERLRNKIRLEDLSSVIGSGLSTDLASGCATGSENLAFSATAHLINLVMQLRKMCNHPDLWERRNACYSCVTGAIRPSTGVPDLICPIDQLTYPRFVHCWCLPRLFYDQGLLPHVSWSQRSSQTSLTGTQVPVWPVANQPHLCAMQAATIVRLFALFHPAHVHADLWHHDDLEPDLGPAGESHLRPSSGGFAEKCFSFSRLMGLSPSDLVLALVTSGLSLTLSPKRLNLTELVVMQSDLAIANSSALQPVAPHRSILSNPPLLLQPLFPSSAQRLSPSFPSTRSPRLSKFWLWDVEPGSQLFTLRCPAVGWESVFPDHMDEYLSTSGSLLLSTLSSLFIPKVVLTPTILHVCVPNFHVHLHWASTPGLTCLPSVATNAPDPAAIHADRMLVSLRAAQWLTSLEPVPLATRVSDSGKLVVLDQLLNQLKPAGHRVLIYSQMTRMIDILEEFMIYRKHAYLRLDGSSRLSDRRDMVAQWQTNPRWFVFLLSTRAGGLGINLTAADTVIFYDSDWNPTVDQQAMDRAHRLGQTKPVTVYRLVCKNTVEERMMQRAEEKRAMQQMVIQSGQNSAGANLLPTSRASDQLTSCDMVSLLLDDDELVKRLQIRRHQQAQRGRPARSSIAASRVISAATSVNLPVTPVTHHEAVSQPTLLDECAAQTNNETPLERKRLACSATETTIRAKKPRSVETGDDATNDD
ncbi:DNA helicase INO80, partial [Paragonimus westermani]